MYFRHEVYLAVRFCTTINSTYLIRHTWGALFSLEVVFPSSFWEPLLLPRTQYYGHEESSTD